MKRIHIIGRKNHGKTTLVVDLVRAFRVLGVSVGTIKHTHHHHELDTPGKDSHRHRDAGAQVVGICSPSMNAVFWPPTANRDSLDSTEAKYAPFDAFFDHCGIVLVEGDSQTTAIKVEVWRQDVGTPPLAVTDRSISLVITDDPLPAGVNTIAWKRADVEGLAAHLLTLG